MSEAPRPAPAPPPDPDPATTVLRQWSAAAALAGLLIVIAVPLSTLRPTLDTGPADVPPTAAFVGSEACRDCHREAFDKWKGSDHEQAMAVADERSVLGDFDNVSFTHRGVTSRFFRRDGKYLVETEGPDGRPGVFEIAYTFGVRPLQQYLVPFPGGRLQCLTIAWDTGRRRWFSLYPDEDIPAGDWQHWTRNAQNWNGMCAECHSTNLKKHYDPEREVFATTWSEISVGCEACHGPGSRHVAWAKIPPMARPALDDRGLVVQTSGITPAALVEVCAPCHARRAELGDYDHSGRLLLDHMVPALLTEGLYEADGQQLDEVYTYASFLQSRMYARGVGCPDCHDSHSARQLRPGNELCVRCHQREVYDSADHHFHKKEVDGRPSDGALCVKCHMPERPYMVVDWRADHSIRRPRPDLTVDIGTPNACGAAGCHADRPAAWSARAYRDWYGRARQPHYATVFAAARRGDASAAGPLLRLVDDVLQPAIVRATALSYLQRYRTAESDHAYQRALASDEALLRHVAAASHTGADPASRASSLAPLLSDPVKAVRLDAAAALAGVPRDRLQPYQREAFALAVDEYRRAMEYSLDFATAGLNLGNLYANLGDATSAERYFRLALKIDDLFHPAKQNLAVLLSGQGRNTEAEALLRAIIAAYPNNGDAAYALGLLLAETGRPADAAAWLGRAVSAMPAHGRARYNLGLLLQQLDRADEAATMLEAAVALEPRNGDFLFALGDHYLKRGRGRDAMDVADRLIAAYPQAAVGHQLRAAASRLAESPGRR